MERGELYLSSSTKTMRIGGVTAKFISGGGGKHPSFGRRVTKNSQVDEQEEEEGTRNIEEIVHDSTCYDMSVQQRDHVFLMTFINVKITRIDNF